MEILPFGINNVMKLSKPSNLRLDYSLSLPACVAWPSLAAADTVGGGGGGVNNLSCHSHLPKAIHTNHGRDTCTLTLHLVYTS